MTPGEFLLAGPRKVFFSVREPAPPIPASGAIRRGTRIAHAVPLRIYWKDGRARTITEDATTESVNCHGFRYFTQQRPPKNASIAFHLMREKDDKSFSSPAYFGRVAWVRKLRRLDGLHLVGVEFAIPLNIWDLDEAPADWQQYWAPTAEDSVAFLS